MHEGAAMRACASWLHCITGEPMLSDAHRVRAHRAITPGGCRVPAGNQRFTPAARIESVGEDAIVRAEIERDRRRR